MGGMGLTLLAVQIPFSHLWIYSLFLRAQRLYLSREMSSTTYII